MEARLGVFDEEIDKPLVNEEGTSHVGEKLSLGESENPAEIIGRDMDAELLERQMIRALETLDQRTQDIIRSRWLTDKKVPLKELGEKYQISLERVRQIEKRAMEALRLELA